MLKVDASFAEEVAAFLVVQPLRIYWGVRVAVRMAVAVTVIVLVNDTVEKGVDETMIALI